VHRQGQDRLGTQCLDRLEHDVIPARITGDPFPNRLGRAGAMDGNKSTTTLSVGAVMQPAGPEKGVGIVTSGYLKEQGDPAWRDDPGMGEFRAFLRSRMPDADPADANTVYGYSLGLTLVQVLRQCDGDFSRENVMRQATGLRGVALPTLLPGIVLDTSPTNYHPIRRMQLQRWDGQSWRRFGNIIEGANA
jgi:hypothetical protein